MYYCNPTRAVLEQLVVMAQRHVEDIVTGIADGSYNASDNDDLPKKQETLSAAQKALVGADPVAIVERLFRVLHPGVVGLIKNHHGEQRGEEACSAIMEAKSLLTADTSGTETFSGSISVDGTHAQVDFQTRIGASSVEKDAAFMAALSQIAVVDYLSIGSTL